jgi:TatD DNase family protein
MKNNYLVDTHCHINLTDDIDSLVMDAEKNNVLKFIISGCDAKSIRDGLEIIYRYPTIYMTVGFHPDEVDNITDKDIEDLEILLKTNKKIVGIGEIGLDYYHNDMNKERQKEFFIKQIELAEKYDLPIVVHSRESIQDVYDILKEHHARGVIHCFSGSLEMANEFIKIGFYLGIGGVLTFKNSKLYQVIEKIDLKDILLETDSPYLSPEPFRGRKNNPYNIWYVAKKIAEIKGIKVEEVINQTTKNFEEIFDI